MRFVSTRIHGILDYLVGIFVLLFPLTFELQGAQRWTLIAIGLAVILYSALTDYEVDVVRFLRIRFHLLLDAVFDIALLPIPWLLDFPLEDRWPSMPLPSWRSSWSPLQTYALRAPAQPSNLVQGEIR